MFLKQLQIHGYKSFANRTEFSFNGGITAIVGPNGSGKSNIADAVRWALGEQSYSVLRAKRTEDLIFSGSAQRTKLGFAEVALVFDNSTHWLPIDYDEITIARRAYRSGDNEYYLNGNRVRLRDIDELMTRGGLGRNASVVIGQGQVDAALSLRAEERRGLFEQAAGVRIHIDKRDEAIARLEETRRNLERLGDIIAEITPRLATLQRQAERTCEYDVVKRDLESNLLLYYGYQWQRHQDRLARIEQQLAEQGEEVRQQRERVQRLAAERETLRTEQQARRDEIRRRRQDAEEMRSRYEEARRRLAVTQERLRALLQQRDQARIDLAGVEARRAELQAGLDRQDQELASSHAAISERQAQAAEARAQLAAAEAAQQAQHDELEQARALAFQAAAAVTAARNRLAQLVRRQDDLEQDLAQQTRTLAECKQRAENAAHELETAERARLAAQNAVSQIEEELRQAEDDLASSLGRLEQLRTERDSAREKHQRISAQNEVLQRTHSQAAHLQEGAQAVIRQHMPGVLGTVSSLIQVPAELEVAMEAALGGHLQDVVTKTWDDALACIDLLKRRERGRATFLPLDYVRPSPSIPPPHTTGVRGIAARLVRADPAYRGICELLLGNIVIVDDLPAGRRALAAETRLRRAVTLDGDVVEARGVIRGGSRPRSKGFLALEREWRELPERLAAAQQALEKAEDAVRAEDARQQACRRQARDLAQRLQAARRTLAQEEQRTYTLRQRHDRLRQEATWHATLEEQARRALVGLRTELAQVQEELSGLERSHQEAAARAEALRADVEREDLQSLRQRATEYETALAVLLRTRQTQEQFAASQREALARAAAEAESRHEQLQRVQGEILSAEQEVDALRQSLESLRQALETGSQPLRVADTELQALEKRQIALEAEEERARQALQSGQSELNRLGFERQRIREDLEEVRRQMEAELGPVDVPDVGQPRQLRLSLGNGATPLPSVTELPDGLTRDLKELRARLRRLGPVNPGAPAEYEELLQRHKFLTDQVQDLSNAADSTREIINELNRLIRERFTTTFAQVAREFSGYFSTLFNGGGAKLVLTEPDNPAESGIEIIARPPGKRPQNLSLLSGGERALTATALLFALLKVNPLPFCVLDEVDAMLDEANVHRFRSLLESLAARTQFIVITHNRATVEAASTVYGVSMAQEGVSQVLSLRLPDRPGEQTPAAVPAA